MGYPVVRLPKSWIHIFRTSEYSGHMKQKTFPFFSIYSEIQMRVHGRMETVKFTRRVYSEVPDKRQ